MEEQHDIPPCVMTGEMWTSLSLVSLASTLHTELQVQGRVALRKRLAAFYTDTGCSGRPPFLVLGWDSHRILVGLLPAFVLREH